MNGDPNTPTPPTGWQYRPGDAITPTAQAAPAPSQVQPVQAPQSEQPVAPPPTEAVAPPSASVASPASAIVSEAPMALQSEAVRMDETGGQDFAADGTEAAAAPESDYIQWSASEYVAHQKTAKWYAALMGSSVAIAAVAYLLTKDVISAVSIVLIAFMFALSAARKPRVLDYQLDGRGLTIAGKAYDFEQFRSFAMIDEGAFSSIALIPLKRLMPVLSIYYDPSDEEQIVAMLANHLPLEQRKLDAIDSLLHKIRF